MKITLILNEEETKQFMKAKNMKSFRTKNVEFVKQALEYYIYHLLSETVSRSTSPNPNQNAQSLLDTAEKTLEQETEDDEQ